ncbi:MAG TPA: DnaA/Hda family protein, partial [Phycisphaerae bacterium]|nr:DnaA/Hda family protein [Phycisphaerae bacterium]
MDSRALSVRADSSLIQSILTRVQQRIGPQKFNAWFRHGTRVSVADGFVRVAVPNPFVAHWIETHYQSDIQSAAGEETGAAASVVVMVDPSLNAELRKGQLDLQADMVHRAAEGRARPVEAAGRPAPLPHRLEDFVLGESNRLAYSAAAAVIRGSQTPFVHLFIHGSCGVGKTHLLQGICNAATDARARALRWRYVTGEQFTNEFVHALRRRKFGEFRARYRGLDLLAIDDVHFLGAKNAIQEEFLHTFNAIESAGKQIVLASDAHPRKVRELNAQLA